MTAKRPYRSGRATSKKAPITQPVADPSSPSGEPVAPHHRVSATVDAGRLTTPDLLDYRNKDFIVILSVGRSGSTLLQGVLNAIPGYLIRGENHSLLLHACRAYRGLQQMERDRAPTTPRSPWYGAEAVNSKEYLEDTARAILRQILADKRDETFEAIGFKEIRWLPADLSRTNLWNYLSFIEEVFPKAIFILLTRDVSSTLSSGWWTTFDPADAAADIESFYLLARSAPVSRFFEIGYEQLVPGSEALHSLLRFLGREYNADIDATLVQPHSFRPASGSPAELLRSYEYMSELEAFRDEQAQQLTRLRGELGTAMAELSRSGEYISELVAFRDQQADEVARLRAEVRSATTELTRSGNYISELSAFRDVQAQDFERLRGELGTAVSELDRSGRYIAELTAFRDVQAQDLEMVRGELGTAISELARSGRYIAELTAFRDVQARELDRLRAELGTTVSELERSGRYIAELTAFRDVQAREVESLRGELGTALSELERSGGYIGELVAFRDQQAAEIGTLRHALQSTSTELSRSASYISELEAFRDVLRDEVTRLRSELEKAQAELARSGAYLGEVVHFRDIQAAELARIRGGAEPTTDDATTPRDQCGKSGMAEG